MKYGIDFSKGDLVVYCSGDGTEIKGICLENTIKEGPKKGMVLVYMLKEKMKYYLTSRYVYKILDSQ